MDKTVSISAVINVLIATMSTDHVTMDVVRVGQVLVVKNVCKMYIAEHLNQIKFRRFKHKKKVECTTTFPSMCQWKIWRRLQKYLRKMSSHG